MRNGRTRRIGALVALLILTMVGAACSSSGSSTGKSEKPSTTASGSDPKFAKPGPYEVGVTTLQLPDRAVEVYYPTTKKSVAGKPKATYDQTDPIPADLRATLPKVPEGVNLTVTIPAYRDVPVAPGKYPLVIFSHGAGGWRGVYAMPLSGLASWGFVVASTDYTEYGLLAQFAGGGANDPARADKVHAAATGTIDLLSSENDKAGSRFHDAIDTKHIGAVGHSAGGGTMFGLLDDKRVGAIVGWAPVGPKTPVTSHTPTMIIDGQKDIAITPAEATKAYDDLLAPKRLVLVGDMGHNAFSDACLAIRSGTDLIGLAKQLGIGIPDRLLELGRNGCGKEDLGTEEGWRIIQQFTVAELRDAFGLDKGTGLAPGIAKAFPGVDITYQQQLK
jgi:predicted dienelactone hydrolase